MKSQYVSFVGPNQATLAEEELSPERLRPGEALIRSQYSIISSGTEGAGFTDLVREMPNFQNLQLGFPRRTGYGHLGEVLGWAVPILLESGVESRGPCGGETMSERHTTGGRIIAAREAKSLSIRRAARRLNVSPRALRGWERGRSDIPLAVTVPGSSPPHSAARGSRCSSMGEASSSPS